ncbi:MAG: peptide chain release factor-like protein [Candidatus Hydrogenedens sp.]|nr:peptide chain release factor-like protein [Candidatus Hydrogenedens sp.]
MSRFGVTDKKEAELFERMAACGLAESDCDESFVRGGGPGGQKVNKTASCVYLKHRPTGLEVKMQQARSQSLNRFYARRRLCELLEAKDAKTSGALTPEQLKAEKIRKQKQRRKRRANAPTEQEMHHRGTEDTE